MLNILTDMRDFLNALLDATKKRKLNWKYLDENVDLCTNMSWNGSSLGIIGAMVSNSNRLPKKFDIENSFYAEFSSTYIVLLKQDNTPCDLYVIPETYKSIAVLKSSEYGEDITRLHNLVKNNFPTAEGFIGEFTKKYKNIDE